MFEKKESKASKRPQRPKNKENCSVEQEEKRGKVSFQKRSLQQAYLNPRVYSQMVVVKEK